MKWKNQYDFAFSLGESCTCSEVLRRVGMQFFSFPFDWISAFSIRTHADLMATDFVNLMPLDKLVCQGINDEQNAEMVIHSETGMRFYHDFPPGPDLSTTYAGIYGKYRRRIQRLQKCLAGAGHALALYVHAPTFPVTSDADLLYASARMRERFPNADIDLLYVYNRPDHGYLAEGIEQVSEHVFKLGMDIRMPPGSNQFISNRKKLIPALRSLFPHGIRDYRTPEERAEWQRRMREKKFAAMHAGTWWEYAVNNFNWRLFRHFRNRLEKLGFENLPSHRKV